MQASAAAMRFPASRGRQIPHKRAPVRSLTSGRRGLRLNRGCRPVTRVMKPSAGARLGDKVVRVSQAAEEKREERFTTPPRLARGGAFAGGSGVEEQTSL